MRGRRGDRHWEQRGPDGPLGVGSAAKEVVNADGGVGRIEAAHALRMVSDHLVGLAHHFGWVAGLDEQHEGRFPVAPHQVVQELVHGWAEFGGAVPDLALRNEYVAVPGAQEDVSLALPVEDLAGDLALVVAVQY